MVMGLVISQVVVGGWSMVTGHLACSSRACLGAVLENGKQFSDLKNIFSRLLIENSFLKIFKERRLFFIFHFVTRRSFFFGFLPKAKTIENCYPIF